MEIGVSCASGVSTLPSVSVGEKKPDPTGGGGGGGVSGGGGACGGGGGGVAIVSAIDGGRGAPNDVVPPKVASEMRMLTVSSATWRYLSASDRFEETRIEVGTLSSRAEA